MIVKLVKTLTTPLYRQFLRPSFRFSYSFMELQQLLGYIPQESVLSTAMDFAKWSQLEGDYLEFGVYSGTRLSSAFHLARRNGLRDMRFYAFDSFQGLPEIRGVDAQGFQQFRQGEYACDLGTFRSRLGSMHVDLAKVEIVVGWYDDVLNDDAKQRLPLKAASIIWVDCDLYESTVSVLAFVEDYIQDGTVLIFDDWFCFRGDPDRGEQRAFREWLERNPHITASEFHKFGWHGNSFILHRK
ncbi:MAG: class I SAM-dependent methyltransferase [Actinomycetota bacterium]|nr:class I SAM-dependent methyltransferase [Actinomycetota bacterium]